MKIITFNIWNHDKNFDQRLDLLISELSKQKADVIALQEVRDEATVKGIAQHLSLSYFWKQYPDCQEGLAILSKSEINNPWTNWDDNDEIHNSGLMHCTLNIDHNIISVMNVHLDYEYASNREIEIVKAINKINQVESDLTLLLGDFNTIENSSVYRFLTGEQSLKSNDACYIDLVESFCVRNNLKLDHTIDFIDNPRWKGANTLEVPKRFDWVLLKEPYPNPNPRLVDYKLLGNTLNKGTTPSDHYGIMVELELVKKV